MRIIAVSLFALALYVVADSLRTLLGSEEAEHSALGLILAGLSLTLPPDRIKPKPA
ncbi:hypothetical protein GCM10010191_49090 [Actinomadura vinacea]|uniref:Uncharacterized protein n=1 Tax=Actinomadura vinacea TaxID=115336 RepID=A0ABP5WLG0_9ACTN